MSCDCKMTSRSVQLECMLNEFIRDSGAEWNISWRTEHLILWDEWIRSGCPQTRWWRSETSHKGERLPCWRTKISGDQPDQASVTPTSQRLESRICPSPVADGNLLSLGPLPRLTDCNLSWFYADLSFRVKVTSSLQNLMGPSAHGARHHHHTHSTKNHGQTAGKQHDFNNRFLSGKSNQHRQLEV